jgi:predicted metal-dependent HD superfamily phosphohydrolase
MNLLCGTPTGADELFADLTRRYAEPHRVYHTLDHIAHVLRIINDLKDLSKDLAAIRLAAWFHDAVYDPTASDNEEQSAAYADRWLARLRLPQALIRSVDAMILATKTHQAEDGDAQVLIDADLAILGADREDYTRYASAIRQEYAWLSDEDYRAGRVRVLQGFLSRERLYLTEPMHRRYDAAARRNLAWEVERLRRPCAWPAAGAG